MTENKTEGGARARVSPLFYGGTEMGKKIVKYRYIILIAFVVILGVSAAFLPTMIEKVNYDLTSYLPDDYETSKGYEFLSDNFNIHGDVEIGLTATRPQIEKAAEDILAIEGVTNTVWAKYFEMLLEFGVYDTFIPSSPMLPCPRRTATASWCSTRRPRTTGRCWSL